MGKITDNLGGKFNENDLVKSEIDENKKEVIPILENDSAVQAAIYNTSNIPSTLFSGVDRGMQALSQALKTKEDENRITGKIEAGVGNLRTKLCDVFLIGLGDKDPFFSAKIAQEASTEGRQTVSVKNIAKKMEACIKLFFKVDDKTPQTVMGFKPDAILYGKEVKLSEAEAKDILNMLSTKGLSTKMLKIYHNEDKGSFEIVYNFDEIFSFFKLFVPHMGGKTLRSASSEAKEFIRKYKEEKEKISRITGVKWADDLLKYTLMTDRDYAKNYTLVSEAAIDRLETLTSKLDAFIEKEFFLHNPTLSDNEELDSLIKEMELLIGDLDTFLNTSAAKNGGLFRAEDVRKAIDRVKNIVYWIKRGLLNKNAEINKAIENSKKFTNPTDLEQATYFINYAKDASNRPDGEITTTEFQYIYKCKDLLNAPIENLKKELGRIKFDGHTIALNLYSIGDELQREAAKKIKEASEL